MANVIRFTRTTGEGDEVEVVLPASYEVCSRCQGEGKHDHPAFSNGISRDQFDEDPDFSEDYFSGVYDVSCEECHGERVTLEVNEAECKRHGLEADLEAYYEGRRDEASYRAECAAERRMGA